MVADSVIVESSTVTAKKSNTNSLGQDEFLKLLVTQLQNQNPLEPMENTEFISQMANFSALEQMTNINSNLEILLRNLNEDLFPQISMQQAANLIGREIAYEDSSGWILNGKVEAISLSDGVVYYVVDGNKIAAGSINRIAE